MTWRILGCGVMAAAIFIGLGLLALNMAIGRIGCPPTLLWGDSAYQAVGAPTSSPVVGIGEPVRLGSTFVGALTRDVYGPEGSPPVTEGDDLLPTEIALSCGDETFQTYEYSGPIPTPQPSP